MTYHVVISGAMLPREGYYDTPEAAVTAASNAVYLKPERIGDALRSLKEGKPYAYAYGFQDVRIMPVCGRD